MVLCYVKVSPTFLKVAGVLGAEPLSRSPQRAKFPMLHKGQEGIRRSKTIASQSGNPPAGRGSRQMLEHLFLCYIFLGSSSSALQICITVSKEAPPMPWVSKVGERICVYFCPHTPGLFRIE